MQARWLKYIPTDEHESFKKRVYSVQDVLSTLDRLLEDSENSVAIARLVDYDSPSWACKQADINGYIRAIREIRALLDLSQ